MNKTILRKRKQGGFSLLELLVVIAIIGILVALGTVSYGAAQRKSRDARRRSDLRAIQNALESYYAVADPNQYPGGSFPNGISGTEYFPNGVPTDPKLGTDYPATSYTTSDYTICADLETDGTFDGANCDINATNLQ